MVRKASTEQLALFDVPKTEPQKKSAPAVEPFVDDVEHHLAESIPRWIRLGTSSWTFPGWNGIVYDGAPSMAAITRGGLAAYARHPLFRTVGIDRGFYKPTSSEDLAEYARALPEDFLAVSKVWEEATIAVYPDHPRYGDKRRQRNPNYLDAELVKYEVLAPYMDTFREHAGPFVFEFSPAPRGVGPTPDEFCEALDGFFAALPSTFRYAVELRAKDHLTPRYLDTLRAHRVAHVLNFWTGMPTLGDQLAFPGVLTTDFVVTRLMQPPYSRYEDLRERYAPFDRIHEKQPSMRGDVLDLVRACNDQRVSNLFVLIGNKAEGCAPLTLRALAESISAMPELKKAEPLASIHRP